MLMLANASSSAGTSTPQGRPGVAAARCAAAAAAPVPPALPALPRSCACDALLLTARDRVAPATPSAGVPATTTGAHASSAADASPSTSGVLATDASISASPPCPQAAVPPSSSSSGCGRSPARTLPSLLGGCSSASACRTPDIELRAPSRCCCCCSRLLGSRGGLGRHAMAAAMASESSDTR